ncbi:MAG: M23 family metallopeptidase [Usitatibacter sp.]
MIPPFGIDSFDTDDDAGPAPAFSLVSDAMTRSLPEAIMVLGLSALGVTGCAIVIETRDPAPFREPAAHAVAEPPRPAPAPPASRGEGIAIPVKGITREDLRDNFNDTRGKRVHRALDIMARRGTPVVAAVDGRVAKVYRHILGGLCVYQYDAKEEHAYYYAHLDAYAEGLAEGVEVKRGDPIGFVGSTGNASPTAPHLHFAVIRLGPDKRWYRGEPVNPFPLLTAPAPAATR